MRLLLAGVLLLLTFEKPFAQLDGKLEVLVFLLLFPLLQREKGSALDKGGDDVLERVVGRQVR